MFKEKNLVSIVMPTLNTNKNYLKESVDSILNQEYSNFEFIIVVDGGFDDEYLKKNYNDKRIKIIKHNETKGLPISLNEAFKICKGKYIVRMDSDDISCPKRIKEQVKFMELHDEIDICGTYYKQFGIKKKNIKSKQINKQEVKSKLFINNIIAHPSVIFRKSSVDQKQLYYNETYLYSQDYELWCRNLDVNIAILPKILLKYRISNQQISNIKKEQQNFFYKKVLCNNLKRLNMNDSYLDTLLALNGQLKSKDYYRVYSFIIKCINENESKRLYNKNIFSKVLKRQFIIYCIKNKVIFNKLFLSNFKYFIFHNSRGIKCI